jgi:hypothetical protein
MSRKTPLAIVEVHFGDVLALALLDQAANSTK